jgi:hypothetical protein
MIKNLGIDDVAVQVVLTTAFHWALGYDLAQVGHRVGFTVPIALVFLSVWRWWSPLKKNAQPGD